MVRSVSAVARKRMPVDSSLVLQGDVGDLVRQGKNDMKVGTVEKFRLPVLQPHWARAKAWHWGQWRSEHVMERSPLRVLWEAFPYGEYRAETCVFVDRIGVLNLH